MPVRASSFDARYPYLAECTVRGCHYAVTCATEDEAWQQIATHRCPRRGDPKMAGLSLLEQAWLMLDEKVRSIYAMHEAAQRLRGETLRAHNAQMELQKAAARGYAEFIALFMRPVFVSADEVSAEAAMRYAEGASRRTPGLNPAESGADATQAVTRRAKQDCYAGIAQATRGDHWSPSDDEKALSAQYHVVCRWDAPGGHPQVSWYRAPGSKAPILSATKDGVETGTPGDDAENLWHLATNVCSAIRRYVYLGDGCTWVSLASKIVTRDEEIKGANR